MKVLMSFTTHNSQHMVVHNMSNHDCCRYIEEDDLMRFLKRVEIHTIFPLFEGSLETGRISKSSFKNWVVSFISIVYVKFQYDQFKEFVCVKLMEFNYVSLGKIY